MTVTLPEDLFSVFCHSFDILDYTLPMQISIKIYFGHQLSAIPYPFFFFFFFFFFLWHDLYAISRAWQ